MLQRWTVTILLRNTKQKDTLSGRRWKHTPHRTQTTLVTTWEHTPWAGLVRAPLLLVMLTFGPTDLNHKMLTPPMTLATTP